MFNPGWLVVAAGKVLPKKKGGRKKGELDTFQSIIPSRHRQGRDSLFETWFNQGNNLLNVISARSCN